MTTAKQVQFRRGTSSQIAAFTGAVAEVVVDTTNHRLVLQDGVTAGGYAAAKLSEVLLSGTTATSTVLGTVKLGTNIQALADGTINVGTAGFAVTNGTLTAGAATFTGGLALNTSGSLTTDQATGNLFNTNATTLNIGGAATAVTIGNATGATLTINPGTIATPVTAGTLALFNTGLTGTLNLAQAAGTINIGAQSSTLTVGSTIVGTATSQNVFNTVATTVSAFGAASTALTMGNASGNLTLNPGTILGSQATQNLFNTVATTMNFAGAATSVSIGAATGTTTIRNALSATGANVSVTLSPTGTGVVTINPATLGSIDNVQIGNTTRAAGKFTTLDANNTVGLSPLNASVTISPTGTGNVVINPATVGSIDKMNIGATTRGTGAFTTLDANSTVGLSPASANVTINPTGTGQVFIQPAAALTIGSGAGGTINNMTIGATTATTGAFTTLTASGAFTANGANVSHSLAPTGTGSVTINPATSGSINNMTIGQTTALAGSFTTLSASTSVTMNTSGAIALGSGAGGSINNMTIGATTATTGAFTTLSASGAFTANGANVSHSLAPTGTGSVTINPATAGNINNMNIGTTTAGTGRFSSLTLGYRAVTGASATIASTDMLVGVNFGGAVALTLPAVASGKYLIIKDESGAAITNNITITPASGTIDGASNLVLNVSYGAYALYSNGTNWFVV